MNRRTRPVINCVVLLAIALPASVLSIPLDRADSTGMQGIQKECPRIVSREEWKARPPKSSKPLVVSPASYVVVHHGGIKSYCHDQETCTKIVQSYQDFHLDVRGWEDIGYSFVIGEDGNAYVGRGWDRVGAHAPGYNSKSIGICIIGDFSDVMPNDAALKALNSLIACGVSMGKISRDYKVIGHRQARDTLCPGETFYKYVKKLPNWTSDPVPLFPTVSPSVKPNVAVAQNSLELTDKTHEDIKH